MPPIDHSKCRKCVDVYNLWCMVETDLEAIDLLLEKGMADKARHRVRETLKSIRRLKKKNGVDKPISKP